MKTRWPIVILVACATAACNWDFNLTGLGDAFSCNDCWDVGGGSWGGGGGYVTTSYHGRISIGSYSAVPGEATVYLYDPDDPTLPVDSSGSSSFSGSEYAFNFGNTPGPGVCDYLAQVVLWNGDSSDLLPLFPSRPTSCDSLPAAMTTRDFELPPYEPLDAPFTLTGHVLIDGAPAPSGVRVDVRARWAGDASVSICSWGFYSVQHDQYLWSTSECVPSFTDASGSFSYSTTDRGQWFVLCDVAAAQVTLPDGTTRITQLGSIARSECTERRLPDVRDGSVEVAQGTIRIEEIDEWVGADEAYVEILDPNDSTVIGDRAWSLDDGSYHLWFPDGAGKPPCDLLVRATLLDGGSEVRALFPGSTEATCPITWSHSFRLSMSP